MMMWKFGWPETSKCWLIAEAHVKDAKKTHVPVQSSTFEWEEIVPFFKSQEEWPKNEKDKNLLVATMVSAAIVAGARTNELNLMTRDCLSIDEATGETLIKLPWRKTKKNGPQSFRVAADVDGPLSPNRWAPQYLALRREAETKYRAEISSEPDSPLWYYVERGKMVNKVVGKNAFGTFPSYIAAKMGLDNPERYTGYACRRSAASHAAEECTTLEMMAHFGWSNAQTAMIYVNQTKCAHNVAKNHCRHQQQQLHRRKQWQHRPTAADGFQQRQTNIGAAYYDHRAYSRQLRNNDDRQSALPLFEEYAFKPTVSSASTASTSSSSSMFGRAQPTFGHTFGSFAGLSFPAAVNVTIINKQVNMSRPKRAYDELNDEEDEKEVLLVNDDNDDDESK